MGQALRKRYKKFLGSYTYEIVKARSSDYARTKVSLQLVLAGLFPPEGALVWNKNLKWQPVASEYWPMRRDHVTLVFNLFHRLRLHCLDFGTTVQELSTVREIVLGLSKLDARPKNVRELQ